MTDEEHIVDDTNRRPLRECGRFSPMMCTFFFTKREIRLTSFELFLRPQQRFSSPRACVQKE